MRVIQENDVLRISTSAREIDEASRRVLGLIRIDDQRRHADLMNQVEVIHGAIQVLQGLEDGNLLREFRIAGEVQIVQAICQALRIFLGR